MESGKPVCYHIKESQELKFMTVIATLFILYWLPTIIVAVRQAHSALGVFLLNFFLGWTVLGWGIALIWALAADNRLHQIIVRVDSNGNRLN